MKGKSLYPKYLNEECNGLRITILDRKKINPIKLTINLMNIIKKNHPKEFNFLDNNFIDKLYGSNNLRYNIVSNKDINVLMKNWVEFNNYKYLLY